MHRPQSVRGLVAVMSSLLAASLLVAPTSAAFAPVEPEPAQVYSAPAKCTKWGSQFTPPKKIRVLRTKRDQTPKSVAGTVQEVDFYEYVAVVMAAEWPEKYPLETLKAGAVATKQFAWYYILHPRGGTKWVNGKKVCYDVVDSVVDQAYYPERYKWSNAEENWPRILAAMDATWEVSVRKYKATTKSSRMFLTGYRAGSPAAGCGQDATGFKLYHNSSRKCGEQGKTYREILRLYLKPNLEIVRPGRHHVIGTKHGDATAMERDSGQLHARAWTPEHSPPEPGSGAGITLANDGLVDYASADMNGDGRDDLVWLRKTGATAGKLKVALSDGTNYGPDMEWWAGDSIVPMTGARLLVGDFHADERVDVAILSKGSSNDSSRLVVLKRKPNGGAAKFVDPVQWWSGAQDYNKIAAAWAADISGDGRADLVLRQNPDGGGVRVKTAMTKSPLPSGDQRLESLKVRFEGSALQPGKVKMIAADANRDGRDDMLLLIGGGGRAKVERLQGQGLGGFKRVKIWTAPKSDPIPVEKTRLGAADIDYDGRTDLILYSNRTTGTRLRVLKTRYDRMVQSDDFKINPDWKDVRPY